jgi:hypothetical protein
MQSAVKQYVNTYLINCDTRVQVIIALQALDVAQFADGTPMGVRVIFVFGNVPHELFELIRK